MTTTTGFEPLTVNARIKISALWTATLIVFLYIDLFSLYRPDVRAALEAGQISVFTIDQAFLLATTLYIVIPSLMLVATLLLRPRVNRIVNITLSVAYALTVVVGAIGEWNYYLLGSAVELALLGSVAYYAWTWPRLAPSPTAAEPVVTRPAVGTSAG
jgi:Family of unknown function (DUF6326)